VPLPIRDTNPI